MRVKFLNIAIITEFFILLLKLQCEGRNGQDKYIPKWKKQACELPQSQNDQSHYICDSSGEVKCLPGWQGDLCDVPMCRKGCDPMNGYCHRPDECRCKIGFYGERCNKCIRLPGCQHGHCNVSFECKCKKGWNGIFCSEPTCRKDCHPTRGYCEVPGECRCRLGWTGPTCNHCQVLPGCQFGTCTKPLECKCLPGYTGLLCQIPICAKNCDRQHGYCRKPNECRCKVGWMGQNCSQCHPYPGCVNGHCKNPWECICEPGWGGILCDEELNYCELHQETCQNGGKCISLERTDGNFRCLCPSGFRGKYCEIQMSLNNAGEYVAITSPPSYSNLTISHTNSTANNYLVNLQLNKKNFTLYNGTTSTTNPLIQYNEKENLLNNTEQISIRRSFLSKNLHNFI